MLKILAFHAIALTLAGALTFHSLGQIKSNLSGKMSMVSPAQEALYLPNGQGLELISFGYKNALANLLWFNTINYFGKHFRSDHNYHWLSHMCGLVTDLNPKLSHVYEFCGLMLAWEARLAKDAYNVLSKGVLNFQNSWRMFYLRGMTSLIFLNDEEAAKLDLVKAAQLPGAHPVLKSLAAKKISVLDNSQTAKEFLLRSIESAQSDYERQVLINRLRELESGRFTNKP